MTGNVDEWTTSAVPHERPSVLKGGYLGSVRTTCRATTRAHGEDFYFYQIGFAAARMWPRLRHAITDGTTGASSAERSMTTQPALTLVDALAEEAVRIGASAEDNFLRSQAALVRALVDEVSRHHPSDPYVANLHEQLGEELSRLADLAPRGAAVEDRAAAAQPVDVLVVDDDRGMLNAEATSIRALGYPCRMAASAEDALREYEQQAAAIVVSDWDMPGSSGLELCAALKRLDPHVYFILVTVHETVKLLDGVRGGVDDFLVKPVDIDDLSVRLRAAGRLVRAMRLAEGVRDRLRARSLRPDA
jgi:CheY-like chemotaxis protein